MLSVDKPEIAKYIEEIKASINKLKDKSIHLISNDPATNSHGNIILYPKQQTSLEMKIAGIREYLPKDENEKVGPFQTDSGRFGRKNGSGRFGKKYGIFRNIHICRNVSHDMWGISGVCTLDLTVAKTSSHYDRDLRSR